MSGFLSTLPRPLLSCLLSLSGSGSFTVWFVSVLPFYFSDNPLRLSAIPSGTASFLSEFSGLHYCLFVKVLCRLFCSCTQATLIYQHNQRSSSSTFLKFFKIFFVSSDFRAVGFYSITHFYYLSIYYSNFLLFFCKAFLSHILTLRGGQLRTSYKAHTKGLLQMILSII